MTHRQVRRIVGSTVLGLALAVGASVALRGLDNNVSNSNAPSGYRGIVSANFDGSNGNDEIIGDFGTAGVWFNRNWGVWVQLTPLNPEWIFAVQWGDVGDWELIADFGANGLWTWNFVSAPGNGTWTRLTASNPDAGIAVDDDNDGRSELQIDFGTLGLWHYDLDIGVWTRCTAIDPLPRGGLRADLWEFGYEEGVWQFSGLGVWDLGWDYRFDEPVWTQLTGSTATEDWAAANFVDSSGTDPNDELAVEFSGLGTWVYDSDGGNWNRITYSLAGGMATVRFGGDDEELVFADSGSNLWAFYGPTWQRLTYTAMDAGFATPYDSDFLVSGEPGLERELAVDFGSVGLWRYNYGTGGLVTLDWQQLTVSNPVFMVRSDYFNDGSPSCLVVSFGAGVGLWLYDSGSGYYSTRWLKLTDSVPDHGTGW